VRTKWYRADVKALFPALLILCSCQREQPAKPTAAQSAQLDDAEKMLNEVAANEEGPVDRSTGPSNHTD